MITSMGLIWAKSDLDLWPLTLISSPCVWIFVPNLNYSNQGVIDGLVNLQKNQKQTQWLWSQLPQRQTPEKDQREKKINRVVRDETNDKSSSWQIPKRVKEHATKFKKEPLIHPVTISDCTVSRVTRATWLGFREPNQETGWRLFLQDRRINWKHLMTSINYPLTYERGALLNLTLAGGFQIPRDIWVSFWQFGHKHGHQ